MEPSPFALVSKIADEGLFWGNRIGKYYLLGGVEEEFAFISGQRGRSCNSWPIVDFTILGIFWRISQLVYVVDRIRNEF